MAARRQRPLTGVVDVGSAFVADEQSFEVVEPGEGALDDPAVASEAGAVNAEGHATETVYEAPGLYTLFATALDGLMIEVLVVRHTGWMPPLPTEPFVGLGQGATPNGCECWTSVAVYCTNILGTEGAWLSWVESASW